VLDQVGCPEDALALMVLWEGKEMELLANGRSIGELLDVAFPSERAVAGLLATRMSTVSGGAWSYTAFYSPSRAGPEPSAESLAGLVARCRAAGVRLHYSNGVDAP